MAIASAPAGGPAASPTAAAAGPLAAPGTLRAAQAGPFLREAESRLASLAAGGTLRLDLTALKGFDSSAIAVLIAVSRRANHAGVVVACLNVPPNLRKLAALYGVDRILFGE